MSLNSLNRYKYTRAAIALAVKSLKSGADPRPSFLVNHPKAFRAKGKKLYQGERLVVAVEDKESHLRTLLYNNKNDYPFGRDSLFHVLKREFLGITKRDIERFLNAQEVIVARRSRPKEQKRQFVARVRRAGVLSGDLAELRPQDVPEDYLPNIEATAKETEYKPGRKMKNVFKKTSGSYHFYNLVDIYTGFLVSEIVSTKDQIVIAAVTKRLMAKMAKALGTRIQEVQFDQGSEFFLSQKDLKESGVHARRMRTNATVEQVNAKYQRIFYTLVAQRRAGYKATAALAVDISNNTLNRRLKRTPAEAVKMLRLGQEVKKQQVPLITPAGIKKAALKVGTKVRALKVKRVKTKAGYKAYKGKHFGPIQTITKVNWYQGYPRYTLDKKKSKGHVSALMWHDEVIRARDADKISRDLVAGRSVVYDVKPKKKKWVDPKIPKRSKRLRKGSKIIYKTKPGTIIKSRKRGSEWEIKVNGTTKWVKNSDITTPDRFVDLT